MAEFTSPASSFTQGLGMAQAVDSQYRRAQAMNYLRGIYGPVADAPQQAQLAENYKYSTEMHPLQVAAQQENNNYLAQAHPVMLEGLKLGNQSKQQQISYDSQMNPIRVQRAQQGVQLGDQAIQAGKIGLDNAQAQQRRAALSTMINGLGVALQQPNADPATIFDQALPTIQQLSPGMTPAELQSYRQAFISDPTGTIAKLQTQIHAANMASLSPADRARVGVLQTQGDIARYKFGMERYKFGIANREKIDALRLKLVSAENIQKRVHLMTDKGGQIDQTIALANQLSDNTIANRISETVGAGVGAQYAQSAKQLEHQLGLIDLQSLANSGFKFGRVLLAEFQAASQAYFNPSLNQTKAQIIGNLTRLKTVVGKINETFAVGVNDTKGQIRALGGVVPGEEGQQGAYYGDPSAPRGLRNNNPVNIKNGTYTKKQPGYSGTDGTFARFSTPAAGFQAADNLLQGYANRGLDTVSKIIKRWAPSSENNTSAYVDTVAKSLGVDPTQKLDMTDPRTRAMLIAAMTHHENGSSPYSPQDVYDAITGKNSAGVTYSPGGGYQAQGAGGGVSIPPPVGGLQNPDPGINANIPPGYTNPDPGMTVNAPPGYQNPDPGMSVGLDGSAPAPGGPQAAAGNQGGQSITVGGQSYPIAAVLQQAQAALARGADPAAVAQRLRELGLDPSMIHGGTGG